MNSLSREEDFKQSLVLAIFNNKEVNGENNSENYENKKLLELLLFFNLFYTMILAQYLLVKKDNASTKCHIKI